MTYRPLPAWQTVSSFLNSWTSVGSPTAPVAFRLSPDRQHVQLVGQLGSGTANTVAFILPDGYRPLTQKFLSAYSSGNGGGRGVRISTNGEVTVMSGVTPPIHLDGLIFALDI
jgi:hypothetical protein